MDNLLDVLSGLILLSAFILMSHKRTRSYIKTFRLQAVLIAAAVGAMGVKSFAEEGRGDLLIVCGLIIVLKVIYIPGQLSKTFSHVEYRVEKGFFLNIPLLILACCTLVVFVYFTLSGLNGQVLNSVSLVLIGMLFMISRKKAIGQIVGFLMMENGLFVAALFSTHGMPLIVDLGVFIDLITAVLIMGTMVFRISEKFKSVDINKLKNLRG